MQTHALFCAGNAKFDSRMALSAAVSFVYDLDQIRQKNRRRYRRSRIEKLNVSYRGRIKKKCGEMRGMMVVLDVGQGCVWFYLCGGWPCRDSTSTIPTCFAEGYSSKLGGGVRSSLDW
jgi:hypothetical protein